MDRDYDYLWIPEGYAAWLGGLRWARAGDAIEFQDELTFALTPQVALFLEGFDGEVPHFAHVLHMLSFLGVGAHLKPPHTRAKPLLQAFVAAERPLRNAGALCKFLCAGLPHAAGIDGKRMTGMLWNHAVMSEVVARWSLRTTFHVSVVELEPPLGAEAFETRFLAALERLQPGEIAHWLKHGCAPEEEAAAQIAEVLRPEKPRTLGDVLDELSERERLSGAVPFVAQMVSALSLPPRRRQRAELPIGGYADVTTRGQPEQLLPSQFAVEDLEFVRRFAQNELLYFRREEPTSQLREELLLVLDQGVRTWGIVRLLLSAAALAFGRNAQRRRLSLRIAATSAAGVPLKVLDADPAALGKMLDASDLSLNPGVALERALEEPAEGQRDVVLLTHPRALGEEEVIAAARRADRTTRVFAVAVTEHGQVALSELRHGVPVEISQFRVDLSVKAKPVTKVLPKPVTDHAAWTGCVEPIGFPFRVGIQGPISHFAFDHEGRTLLTVSHNGILHLWVLDGSSFELLPRPMEQGLLLWEVRAVVGVAGGYVLGVRSGQMIRHFHYDLRKRTCAVLPLQFICGEWRWYYVASHHSIAVRLLEPVCYAIDLDTRDIFHSTGENGWDTRAGRAAEAASRLFEPPPAIPIDFSGPALPHPSERALHYDPDSGTITIHGKHPKWQPFTPVSDGKPCLRGAHISQAQCAGNTLAFVSQNGGMKLRVFAGPDGTPLGEFPTSAAKKFLLSSDGRWLARQTSTNQLLVHEITRSPGPALVTVKGRSHQDLTVKLGHRKLLVSIGKWKHLIRWDRGPLETFQGQGTPNVIVPESEFIEAVTIDEANSLVYDTTRFRSCVRGDVDVIVDRFGQIIVLDHARNLVAMLFVFRNQVAAWLPDGTRYGPAAIIGGASTEGALEAIGKRLREAGRRGWEEKA